MSLFSEQIVLVAEFVALVIRVSLTVSRTVILVEQDLPRMMHVLLLLSAVVTFPHNIVANLQLKAMLS